MVVVKSYAKLNIALKIVGEKDGYHMLDSVVSSVDKFDVITAKKRNDDKILITFTGKYGFTPKCQADTNAYKAVELFMKEFGVKGVDVTVKRNIPTAGGMGASSADIAGVLYALKKLYKVEGDIKPLADKLGSDAGYLLTGGFARITGRGEIVEKLPIDQKYYYVVIYAKSGVNTKDCFAFYDEKFKGLSSVDVDSSIKALSDGDLKALAKVSGNDLYLPASSLNSEINKNLDALKSLSPDYCCMTGSGSTCFSIYKEYEMASWAYFKLKKIYGDRVDILSSFDPEKLSFFERLWGVYPSSQD